MENKVIDITADPVDVSRIENEIVSQVSITEISTAIVTEQVTESTQYNFNIAVNLTGYGEESVTNNALFFRPDFSTHIVSTSERFSKAYGKRFNEQFTRSEQISLLVAKAQTEIISTSELITLVASFSRTITDTVSRTDTTLFSVGKSLVDTSTATDLPTLLYNSSKLDQTTTSDVLSTLSSFNRQINDTVVVTDDVLGLANVDDDQVAEVQKVLADSSTLTEIFSKLVGKVLADSTTNSEVTSLLYNKAVNETVSRAEELSLSYSKIDTEVLALQELFTTTTTWQREVTELVNKQDLVTLAYNKQQNELLSTSEQTVLTYNKAVLDSVVATDDFYGVANTDDDQIASLGKVLLDSATLSELVTTQASFLRTILDTATNTERFVLALSVVYADQTTNSEQVAKNLGKNPAQELLALAGTDLVSLTTNKQTLESLSASDTVTTTSSFQRAPSEILAVSEVFSTLSTFNRQINDTVLPTDDILGLANVDDDQVASVTKVIADTGTTSDLLLSTTTYNRDFSDTSVNTDLALLVVQSSYIESISLTEILTFVANKQLTDTSTTADLAILTNTFNRDYTDTYTSSDLVSQNIQKAILDQFANTDTSSHVLTKAVVDATALASIDSATIVVAKVLADITSAIQEVITLETIFSRSLVETVANSETKTANIQNFFQSDFVEAGYVGINLTL